MLRLFPRGIRRSLPTITYFLLRVLLVAVWAVGICSSFDSDLYEHHTITTGESVRRVTHNPWDPIKVHDILSSWLIEAPSAPVCRSAKRKRRRRRKFGGRLEQKSRSRNEGPTDWTSRAIAKLVFVYMRFSSREQREKNTYSHERQAHLAQLAIQHGAQAELSPQEIEQIKARPDYQGWYQDGQIIVEERDLVGISGTKGQEDRPGFAYMVSLIEQGLVSAVYVVDVTRLFRDQYLINATQFAKLCAEKGVVVVTEGMTFDLTDDMHREFFIEQARYASRELKMILNRLGGSRQAKSDQGKYAGDAVSLGYVVLPDKERPNRLSEYAVYEPQAKIIRLIFAKMLELRRVQAVALWCNRNGIFIPAFETQFEYMRTRSSVRSMRPVHGADGEIIGYKILRSTVLNILENPMYIGKIYRTGRLVKDNPALLIVEENVFEAVQSMLEQNQPRSRSEMTSKLLTGLLYCIAHGEELYPIYCTDTGYACSRDQCAGLRGNKCFVIQANVFDIPVSEAVLSTFSGTDRAEQIVTQLEKELRDRQSRAQSYKRERERLENERESLVESLAFFYKRETDPRRRDKLLEDIYQQIYQREAQLDELAKRELAPIEAVLATAEITMVSKFLTDLGTRWEEIPITMRNNFLRVILNHVLVQEDGDRYYLRIVWRSGFEQHLVVFRPAESVRKRKWTEQEVSSLREHYATASREEFEALLPGREWQAIHIKAHRLGLRRGCTHQACKQNRPWTPEEDQVLRDYDTCKLGYGEMRKALSHRTHPAIGYRAKVLGIQLRKARITWRFVDFIRENEQSRGTERSA